MGSNVDAASQERMRALLVQKKRIQEEIEQIQSSTSTALNFQHYRSPIRRHDQCRSRVPRSLSTNAVKDGTSNGAAMSRLSANDRLEAPLHSRILSQSSAPGMIRTPPKDSNSSRNLLYPPTLLMTPSKQVDSQRDNQDPLDIWERNGPGDVYTFSQMRRSPSQRKSDLEQVPELGNIGESPADFIARTLSLSTPIPFDMSSSSMPCDQSSTASRYPFSIPTPSTPTTSSLTDATTYATMSRQTSSRCNEPLLESIQMMKVNSQGSHSSDILNFDIDSSQAYLFEFSCQPLSSSDEKQSQLLRGAGGASQNSQIVSQFAPVSAALAQYQFSAGSVGGEKMEFSSSNQSSSSTFSDTRNQERLQVSNHAAARPLMPKAGSDNHVMRRDGSSQSMFRQDSRNDTTSSVKIAISKPAYQRPKHERLYCQKCDENPEGFRGEHELRRHTDRQHKAMVKKWICIEPSGSGHPKPILPLSRCKSCTQLKKKYGAYYNAAAHLRRAHFKPKAKGRSKSTKLEDSQKRGGKGEGDWPPMPELKHWMKEVEEPAPEYPMLATEQPYDDYEDDDLMIDILDPPLPNNDVDTCSISPYTDPILDFLNIPSNSNIQHSIVPEELDVSPTRLSSQPLGKSQAPLHQQQYIDIPTMNVTDTRRDDNLETSLSSYQDLDNDPSLICAYFDMSSVLQSQHQNVRFDDQGLELRNGGYEIF